MHFDPQFDKQGSARDTRDSIRRDWNWAGVRRMPYPDNVWAASLHTNLLNVLANDGVDIFVLLHGKTCHSTESGRCMTGTLKDVPLVAPPTVGGYKALEPNSVNAAGEPNKLLIQMSALHGHIPIDPADPRWAAYYASVRARSATKVLASNLLQYVLIQTRHMTECNEWVNTYAARTGVKYKYKMRLRTDILLMKPFPHPRTLKFGSKQHPIIHTANREHALAIYDKIGFGEEGPMDVYMSRYPALFSNITLQRGWTTEYVLQIHLQQEINATVEYNSDILVTVIRPKGYTRGKGVT